MLFAKMSFKAMFCSIVITIVLLVVMDASSGCHSGQKCFYADAASPMEIQSRKALSGLKSGLRAPIDTENGQNLVYRELRNVPSGPDPLHHNGGSPKKPRTP